MHRRAALVMQSVLLGHEFAVKDEAVCQVVEEVEHHQDRHDVDQVSPDRARLQAHTQGQDRGVEDQVRDQAGLAVDLDHLAEALPGQLLLIGLVVEFPHALQRWELEDEAAAQCRQQRENRDEYQRGHPVVVAQGDHPFVIHVAVLVVRRLSLTKLSASAGRESRNASGEHRCGAANSSIPFDNPADSDLSKEGAGFENSGHARVASLAGSED